MTEPLEQTLRRLKDEREDADRRYNDALTALDRALPQPPDIDVPIVPLDEARLAELNQRWNILPDSPPAAGLRGRLAGFIWRIIAPYLQRQMAFNSILVDHINRNSDATKAAHRRDEQTNGALHAYVAALGELHSRLMVYLQQITAYVDTKDRDSAGGALVLNAALSDLAESQAKYRESFAARELRYDARTTAIAAAYEDLRGMVGVAQQALGSLRRHVEGASGRDPEPGMRSAEAGIRGAETAARGDSGDAFAASSLDAYKYVGFEDQFRGSRAAVRERQQSYVPYFAARPDDRRGEVLDVGCGRGEFIELLLASGVAARGIDTNADMVDACRSRGLNVVRADAVGYLAAQTDDSLAGIFAAQVVEHFEPAYLLQFLELAAAKLQPGGMLVLETLNPACWTAFFESYIRDITHRWPLHPETLKYLVTASGFNQVTVEYRSPVPPHDKLQTLRPRPDEGAEWHDVAEAFNANAEKLNSRLFTFLDYAIVARTPEAGG